MKILLVEDDRLMAEEAIASFQELGYRQITVLHSAKAAVDFIDKTDALPDLAVLDIELEKDGLNGFELAEMLLEKKQMPIIFWTSHDKEYAGKKAPKHASFLPKSTGKHILAHHVNLAIENFEKPLSGKPKEYLWITKKVEGYDRRYRVPVREILWLESNDGYTDFYTENQIFKAVNRPLSEFEKSAEFPSLIRTHKKYVANIDSSFFSSCRPTAVFYKIPPLLASLFPQSKEIEILISKSYWASVKQVLHFNR